MFFYRRGILIFSLSASARRFDPALPATALASYPGSGNTWVRALLEGATGVLTGSVYVDPSLVNAGFLGEGATERVLAVKTHWPWDAHNATRAPARAHRFTKPPPARPLPAAAASCLLPQAKPSGLKPESRRRRG